MDKLTKRRKAWEAKEQARREFFWNKNTINAGAVNEHFAEERILLMAESIKNHGTIVYDDAKLNGGKVNQTEIDAAKLLAAE